MSADRDLMRRQAPAKLGRGDLEFLAGRLWEPDYHQDESGHGARRQHGNGTGRLPVRPISRPASRKLPVWPRTPATPDAELARARCEAGNSSVVKPFRVGPLRSAPGWPAAGAAATASSRPGGPPARLPQSANSPAASGAGTQRRTAPASRPRKTSATTAGAGSGKAPMPAPLSLSRAR
jgi:hypothetical protein